MKFIPFLTAVNPLGVLSTSAQKTQRVDPLHVPSFFIWPCAYCLVIQSSCTYVTRAGRKGRGEKGLLVECVPLNNKMIVSHWGPPLLWAEWGHAYFLDFVCRTDTLAPRIEPVQIRGDGLTELTMLDCSAFLWGKSLWDLEVAGHMVSMRRKRNECVHTSFLPWAQLGFPTFTQFRTSCPRE